MTKRRRIVLVFAILATAAAFLPVSDSITHPQKVILKKDVGVNPLLTLNVSWFDLGLNTNFYTQSFDFDTGGEVMLPPLRVKTPLWKYAKKRVLVPFDQWTACENCYGPTADCYLTLKNGYALPDKMRLVQNRSETGNTLVIRVGMIPDERKYALREFHPTNVDALLVEARTLIAKGDTSNIARDDFGSELLSVDPVRVECRQAALILWMGGKTGYALTPDSSACPAFNRMWITGTAMKRVHKLERM